MAEQYKGEWSGVTKEDLEARPPHVVLSPEIIKLSKELTAGETDPLRKAFKIWSWIDENIKWAAEIEYSTITNIVEKVYSCKRGDCGTQALLFVSLCRASGVPARWQSGWVTRPREWNMHDWAEFYTPQYGWLPADPSVGRRKSDEPEIRDYLFGHLDSYRMIANTDCEQPFDPPMKHLRSDPVDNQRGELEWEGGNLYYDEWDYDIQVTSEPAESSPIPAAENP